VLVPHRVGERLDRRGAGDREPVEQQEHVQLAQPERPVPVQQ
jgi:hypothetical protein